MFSEFIEHEYAMNYKRFCEVTNGGGIDRLNKKFKELYPDYDYQAYDVDDFDNPYCRFMKTGYEELLKDLKTSHIWFDRFYIGDELQFIGVLKDGTKVEFVLKKA